LRSVDAPHILKVIKDVADTGNLSLFYTDDIRYSFINLKSLLEHGSVEFRGMRSTQDFEALTNWTKALQRLKASSLTYNAPSDILEDYERDPTSFITNSLGDCLGFLATPDTAELVEQGLDSAAFVGMRADWSKIADPVSKNPFAKAIPIGVESPDGHRLQGLYPRTLPAPTLFVGSSRNARRTTRAPEWTTVGVSAVAPPNTIREDTTREPRDFFAQFAPEHPDAVEEEEFDED
jgi:hypothetical protein